MLSFLLLLICLSSTQATACSSCTVPQITGLLNDLQLRVHITAVASALNPPCTIDFVATSSLVNRVALDLVLHYPRVLTAAEKTAHHNTLKAAVVAKLKVFGVLQAAVSLSVFVGTSSPYRCSVHVLASPTVAEIVTSLKTKVLDVRTTIIANFLLMFPTAIVKCGEPIRLDAAVKLNINLTYLRALTAVEINAHTLKIKALIVARVQPDLSKITCGLVKRAGILVHIYDCVCTIHGEPEPQPEPQPEPETAQPEPEVAQPEPEIAQPEPEVAQPEPETAQPEPEVAQPEPETAQPEPETAQPEPEIAQPEPEVAQPEPQTSNRICNACHNVGDASTFGILASTFSNTGAGTSIDGDVGYTTPPSQTPTYGGMVVTPNGDPPGLYADAGADQASTLAELNDLPCMHNFSGATDLSTVNGGNLVSGVYCIAGSASIGTAGIRFLDEGQLYVFRIEGILTTVTGSEMTITSMTAACNIFWTPVGATTLAANSAFVGTLIDPAGVTTGANVQYTGRILAFGGTVTTDSTAITVPCFSA